MRQNRQVDQDGATAVLLERARSVPAGPNGFAAWSDPDGQWQVRPSGEWSSGYAVGLRWLAALRPALATVPAGPGHRGQTAAGDGLTALRVGAGPRSAFRGFRGYFGAVPGDLLHGDPAAANAVVTAARALAADRHPAAGIIPLAEVPAERLRPGSVETSIDAVGPTVGLLARAAELTGDERLARLAAHQADWHLRTLVRADGSVAQYALLDPAGGRPVEVRTGPQGLRPGSTWARSQSWGLLAAALAARWLPHRREPMLHAGAAMAAWWAAHTPPGGVPRWDFDAPPGDPWDTSATAITAAALLTLSAMEPGTLRGRRHRAAAEAAVDALVALVTNGTDGRPAGMLPAGCYHLRTGLAPDNELVWGDYHLLETLLALAGDLDPLAH